MFKRALFLLLLIASGCGTATNIGPQFTTQGFIPADEFCRKHNLDYTFDTIDDVVRIYSPDVEARLMLSSPVGYNNGNIFYMNSQPFYLQGRIFLPQAVEEILYGKGSFDFRVPFAVKTIAIDPGHGGKDPGALSPYGGAEKDINLRVAKCLENELKKRGYRVVMTRSRDMYLTLEERVDVAHRYNADLFISIHSNANKSRNMSGTEVYYLTPAKLDTSSRSLQLARSKDNWLINQSFTPRAILWDMVLTKNYALSVESSQIFYNALRDTGFKSKPPKQANYHVLRNAYTPAILVEIGYMTNAYEVRMLKQPNYQRQLAEALALAVVSLNRRHTDLARGR